MTIVIQTRRAMILWAAGTYTLLYRRVMLDLMPRSVRPGGGLNISSIEGRPSMSASALSVFVGGSIGNDPFSTSTWSGSSRGFLNALEQAGALAEAISVELPFPEKSLLMLKNFNPDRGRWRRQFYLDTAYRERMTRAALRTQAGGDVCLQIGHWYSLPDVFPHSLCLSYHDGNLAGSRGLGPQGLDRRVQRTLDYEIKTANRMSAILTFSDYLRQSFINDYHVPPEKVFNVGGGVNLDQIPAVEEKNFSSRQILFVGTEFARKGGLLLLKAFRHLRRQIPDVQLHIVGPQNLPESLAGKVPDGIIWHGHLSRSNPDEFRRLTSLFRTSSLFVLPSRYEPFGIAPLEAMLYRVPCVLTNDWAFREFVTHGANGLLINRKDSWATPGEADAEELADLIVSALDNPPLLEVMGNRSREMVLRNYTWPAVVERVLAVVEKLSIRA